MSLVTSVTRVTGIIGKTLGNFWAEFLSELLGLLGTFLYLCYICYIIYNILIYNNISVNTSVNSL